MIGLDTNILVRYLAQDDKAQAAKATELIESLTESDTGFISTIVLVETYWVLCRAYKTDRPTVARILTGLLTAREIVVEQADAVGQALRKVSKGADFADALIEQRGVDAGCAYTVTFDKNAAQRTGMQLLN